MHVFGIRHHGPGCARSLRAALEELQPDVIVMEGPLDAESALPLASHHEIEPPVALLLYPKDQPRDSVLYPMTVFSPEWQALRWAQEHAVPVRLMDLPTSMRKAAESALDPPPALSSEDKPADEEPSNPSPEPQWRIDPISVLAEAAGYQDHELWWEEQIERRSDATGLFEAILEAMQAVREEFAETRTIDLIREAHMRKIIRKVKKEDFNNIAIICGAWHAPVLDEPSVLGKRDGMKIKDDNALLKGLKKSKTVATWIPWTHSRLSYLSGYGAGIHSPGWYAHVWESPEHAPVRWIASAARLLRAKDLDASSASVIEAKRLAETLAAIRELRTPGLTELNESILTVLCHGDDAPLRLIRRKLEVGDVLGKVPAETIAVPLAQDLAKLQKSLRMKPTTEIKIVDLDLREETGLRRSQLLHQLLILSIRWGKLEQSGGSMSTFREVWQLEWQPEFAISIIEANIWGNTVVEASTARAIQHSQDAPDLAAVTQVLDYAILGGLDDAIEPLLSELQNRAAIASDVIHLMQAVGPLARILRYSDVRGTQATQVEPILLRMFERIIVGLPLSCVALDDAAAEQILKGMQGAQEALDLLQHAGLQQEWTDRLAQFARDDGAVHGLIRGWSVRILLEKNLIAPEELQGLTRLALSPVVPTQQAAAWVSGLLSGSGLLLIHQDVIWHVFDHWLKGLNSDVFTELLPVLRRAFSSFSGPERRQMGDKVKRLPQVKLEHAASASAQAKPANIDERRARKVLPVLAHILGVDQDD